MNLQGEQSQQTIRLAILAPALAVRLGLRALLQEITGCEIKAEAASIQALEVELSQIDIILAVDQVPDLEWLSAAGETAPAVLLLSETPQAGLALKDYFLSAWGILPLEASVNELSVALQALKAGLWVGDPVLMTRRVILPLSGFPAQENDTLTNRELEVLQGLAQGLANKQIGLKLGISEHTVKFHISSIYTKLGATNRAEAMRIGIQKGWITL
jgi:DNA-binding NarL/FixJ family response regulator